MTQTFKKIKKKDTDFIEITNTAEPDIQHISKEDLQLDKDRLLSRINDIDSMLDLLK